MDLGVGKANFSKGVPPTTLKYLILLIHMYSGTFNKGHLRTEGIVPYSEVVPYWEVFHKNNDIKSPLKNRELISGVLFQWKHYSTSGCWHGGYTKDSCGKVSVVQCSGFFQAAFLFVINEAYIPNESKNVQSSLTSAASQWMGLGHHSVHSGSQWMRFLANA